MGLIINHSEAVNIFINNTQVIKIRKQSHISKKSIKLNTQKKIDKCSKPVIVKLMKIKNQWDEEFEVNVGDWVGFKSDIEQDGKVKQIQYSRRAMLVENKNGFDGDYIGGDTEALVGFDEVWKG